MEAAMRRAVMPQAVMRAVLLAATLLVSMGARQKTANFIIETADPAFAQQAAQAAEKYRHDLAVEWLGHAMPNWSQPCVITIQVGAHLGAGGATTFVFDRGEVFGWRMSIQGSAERVLDSVLPHEITHMIFASHFRQPLPRWADEGGATSVEHASERNKHRQMLNQFLRTGRGIAFSQMFAMTEYPQDIMPLYAQGYSLADFLIQAGGRRKFVEFLGDGLKNDDWSGALSRHYAIQDLGSLQNTWLAWVQQGCPRLSRPNVETDAGDALLAANARRPRPQPNLIYRIRDKLSPPAPLANLVPVRAAGNGATAVPPVRQFAASVPPSKTKTLPASGWQPVGAPRSLAAASPSAAPHLEAAPRQVTCQPSPEQPRQTTVRD